jgi:hypothetical protein
MAYLDVADGTNAADLRKWLFISRFSVVCLPTANCEDSLRQLGDNSSGFFFVGDQAEPNHTASNRFKED